MKNRQLFLICCAVASILALCIFVAYETYQEHVHFQITLDISQLTSSDPAAVRAAEGRLVKIGKLSVPPLLDLLYSSSKNKSIAAAAALGRIGPDAKSALPHLLSKSQTETSQIQLWCHSALARIADDPRPHLKELTDRLTKAADILQKGGQVRTLDGTHSYDLREFCRQELVTAAMCLAAIGKPASDAAPVIERSAQQAEERGDNTDAALLRIALLKLRQQTHSGR